MNLTLAQLVTSLDGILIGDDRSFSQVSINTRTMQENDIFVAIKGDNFDGHQYIGQAEKNGACGLVVEEKCQSDLPQLVVKNTRLALGDIAKLWRSTFSIPVVAITGSCGKTTVKEMTAAIFQSAYGSALSEKILATKGNLNNEIGVPLTLFRLEEAHKAAVIELGANHAGEIKYLVDLVKPDVAVITNVTPAHIEGFGSIEGIAKAKAEIYSGLDEKGIAIINADDDFSDYWQTICQGQNQVTFGLNQSADVSAEYKALSDGFELKLKTPIGEQIVHLHQFGQHNIYNALTATALAISAGCTLNDVCSGLESFTNASRRLEKKSGLGGSVIFDDTYNANPGSVRAGIDAIKQVEGEVKGEAILILGDMAELGEEALQLHYQLGVDAANMGIKQLFTVGLMSQETTNGYNSILVASDDMKTDAQHFDNKNELVEKVKLTLHKNSIVLVKGSRSMAMENVVENLLEITEGVG